MGRAEQNVSSRLRSRGRCPICNYSVTIRRNGYAERHYLYTDAVKWACPGGEEMRRENDKPSALLAWWMGGRDAA